MANTIDTSTPKTTDAPIETDEAATQNTTQTAQKQVETKPTPPPPKDTAEKDTGEQDVDTKDSKSVFGRLADAAKQAAKGAKKASKKAFELTAEAQNKANKRAVKQADKPVNKAVAVAKKAYDKTWKATAKVGEKVAEQPRDWQEKAVKSAGKDHLEFRKQTNGPKLTKADAFWAEAGDKAGLDASQVKKERAEAAEVFGRGKGNPAGYFRLLGAVDSADTIVSVVRNANAIRAADQGSDAMKIINAGKTPAPGSKALGIVSFGLTAAKNVPVIVEDWTDADGPSLDSVVPAYNIIADGVGLIPHPGTIAFSIGNTIGSFIYDDMGLGKAMDERHTRAIERHTQIGILEDRAPRFDESAKERFLSGSATDQDFAEARTVSREAHEHGLLNEDGTVDRLRLAEQMPMLSMRLHEKFVHGKRVPGNEHHYQVMEGIELAVQLDNMAQSREPSDARVTRVSTTPTERR